MFVYNMKYVLIKDKKKRTCNIIVLFFNQCYGIIVALFKILHCLDCFPGDGQRASCLLLFKNVMFLSLLSNNRLLKC